MYMSIEKVALFEEDFALLIEAGFIAVKQLDETSARRLFLAAQSLKPDHIAPQVGIGYISLNKLEIKEATRIFEEVIQKEPEHRLTQTFLAICFLLTKGKQQEGESRLSTIAKEATDPTIQHLCALAMEWSQKELSKKMREPAFTKRLER